MTRYRFIGTLTNTAPLTITSAQKTRVRTKKKNSDDYELFPCIPDSFKPAKSKDGYNVSFPFMNKTPVIPASSIKGALRWFLTSMIVKDTKKQYDPKVLSLMAVGGVTQQGDCKASPTEKIELKGLVSQDLFGASAPFMRGSFLEFSNAYPVIPNIKLICVPTIRKAVYNDPELYDCSNKELMDEIWKKDIDEAKKAKNTDNETEGDGTETGHVQSAQLHQTLGFAEGTEFSHKIDMEVDDNLDTVGGSPFAVFLHLLKAIGVNGFHIGGGGAQGFGGKLNYSYEVKRLNHDKLVWEHVGEINCVDHSVEVTGVHLTEQLATVDMSKHIEVAEGWEAYEPKKKK